MSGFSMGDQKVLGIDFKTAGQAMKNPREIQWKGIGMSKMPAPSSHGRIKKYF